MIRKSQAQRNVRRAPAAPSPPPETAAKAEAPKRRRARIGVGARLRAWRAQHAHDFRASFGRLARRPWTTLMTVLMLGFALALPLLFYVAFDNARALSGGVREAREVTVFLKPDVAAERASSLAAELEKRTDVAAVLVRTPEEGLAEFRKLSGFGEALDALDANPLPTVVVVTPRGLGDIDDPPLVADLRADARVDLVQYDAAWRHRLSDILGFGERAVAVAAILLALATLLVVANIVRADVQSRTEEIEVMQLIGAGDGFVRRPFLYTGFWYGLFGGALALVVAIAAELAVSGPVERLLASYDHAISLRGVGAGTALAVLAASALLGWLGAFVATGRHIASGHPK